MGTGEPALDHVAARLDALMIQVRTVVDARRSNDPGLDDPFLGLYISEDRAATLLDGRHPTPSSPQACSLRAAADTVGAERGSRLHRLREAFDLTDDETDALLICLAPDVEARFEQLYGFCNDDVTLKRATVGLVIELLGGHPADIAHRDLLAPDAALVRRGLLTYDGIDRPFLTRSLVVPDRVTSYLLGGDRVDPALTQVLSDPEALVDADAEGLARVIDAGVAFVHLVDPKGWAPETVAGAACLLGRGVVALDLRRIRHSNDLESTVASAAREASLTGAVLFAGPVDALVDEDRSSGATVSCLAEQDATVVVAARTSWDPGWSRMTPLQLSLARVGPDESVIPESLVGLDGTLAETLSGQFQLRPTQVRRAAAAATMLAVWDDSEVRPSHLSAGARQQNGARLERVARRLEPTVGWGDLVLPDAQVRSLRRLADRARHRRTVLGTWGMRPGGGRGIGVMALFAGESGTGKTMSAEVIATDLGLDLYVVNLATVVDKYVGETEKNLDRIFADADDVNGVLLFDEADALFGSRSEVRDSHDRYANLEVAYLLQRIESFDGLALLSTNLRSNLDDAFARRLDATIEFPVPGPQDRLRLWELTLAPLTLDDDVDLSFCSVAFELTGGNIRSAGISCGYAAAAAGADRVSMEMLVRAIGDEYRKLGRLCIEAEFGPYLDAARA